MRFQFAALLAASIAVSAGAGLGLAQGISVPGQPAPDQPLPPQPEPPATPAPPQPAPPGPAPGAPAAGGLVTTVNVDSLKAVFDQNNVPATIQSDSGFTYVSSTLNGNAVYVVPMACINGDAKGDCKVVMLASANWQSKMKLSVVMDFVRKPHFASVVVTADGYPFLRYAFAVTAGVGPDYIKSALIAFGGEMTEFAGFASAGGKFGVLGSSVLASSFADVAGQFGNEGFTGAGGRIGP